MSKFNISIARPAGRGQGPLRTEATPSGRTHEGGAGYRNGGSQTRTSGCSWSP